MGAKHSPHCTDGKQNGKNLISNEFSISNYFRIPFFALNPNLTPEKLAEMAATIKELKDKGQCGDLPHKEIDRRVKSTKQRVNRMFAKANRRPGET